MRVNDYHFHIEDKGSGDLVLFVHGSVSDWRTWKGQLEAFGKTHHAIAYSRRFHWPNEKIAASEDYSMRQHVDDLQAIMGKIGRPMHLVGHSYGAFICLLAAARAAQNITSLVLAEPPAITLFVSNEPKPLELARLFLTRPGTALALIKFARSGVIPATQYIRQHEVERAVETFGKATLGEEAYSRLSEARMEQVMENVIPAEFLGSGFPPLPKGQIKNISVPTLLLAGEKSPKLFHLLLDRLEQLMPFTERRVIPGASHISHEDEPGAYHAIVLDFFRRQGR